MSDPVRWEYLLTRKYLNEKLIARFKNLMSKYLSFSLIFMYLETVHTLSELGQLFLVGIVALTLATILSLQRKSTWDKLMISSLILISVYSLLTFADVGIFLPSTEQTEYLFSEIHKLVFFFPYWYVPQKEISVLLGSWVVWSISYSLVAVLGYNILWDRQEWIKQYKNDQNIIQNVLNKAYSKNFQCNFLGSSLKQRIKINESLTLSASIDSKYEKNIIDIGLWTVGFTFENRKEQNIPAVLKPGRVLELEYKLNPVKPGHGKFSIIIVGELGAYRTLINPILQKVYRVKNPIFFTDLHRVTIYPDNPNIEFLCKLSYTEQVSVGLTLKNEGKGLAKNIQFQTYIPETFKVIQSLQPIDELPPDSPTFSRDLVFLPENDELFSTLEIGVMYENSIGITSELILKVPIPKLKEKKGEIDRRIELIRLIPEITREEKITTYDEILRGLDSKIRGKGLDPEKAMTENFKNILQELFHYRNKVKNSHWKKTKKFKESGFHNDIESYLDELGKFHGQVHREPKYRSKDKPDLTIKGIPIELKRISQSKSFPELKEGFFKQLKQYCSSLNSKHGFLAVLDVSSQGNDPEPHDIEDFDFDIEPKGSIFLLLAVVYIRGGEKTSASQL